MFLFLVVSGSSGLISNYFYMIRFTLAISAILCHGNLRVPPQCYPPP